MPNNVICAFPEKFNVEGNGRHFHDSEQAHVKLWPTVVLKHKELGDFGYEEIPRGRIMFDYKSNKFLAYVCEDFVHYNFGSNEIDPADIDD